MLDDTALSELRSALQQLSALLSIRLEERGATSAWTTAQPQARVAGLLERPLALEGGEGLPVREALHGSGPFGRLMDAYDLSPAEAVTVLAALAPEVDEKFDVLYGLLADRTGSEGLTGEVLRTLVGRGFQGRLGAAELLAPGAKLRGLKMLTLEPGDDTLLSGRLRLNPELASWLLGRSGHEPEFSPEFPAQRLRTLHRFDDLVVAGEVGDRLLQVLQRIRFRSTVLGVWGFGRHHDNAAGFHVLFHGPSGTGKTMAAAIIGRETDMPVFRIDLSTMVSKYIGETEKNLSRIFDRAEARDWILFFDEADALFGRRAEVRDARDRYANQEVSYLLQRMETFSGISILATNFLRNVDESFLRRIHAQVAFPEPDVEERTALWRSLVPPEVPLEAGLDFDGLAEEFELTGGEIRNAIFHAAFLACADGGVVREDHFRDGVLAELEKSGRMAGAGEAP